MAAMEVDPPARAAVESCALDHAEWRISREGAFERVVVVETERALTGVSGGETIAELLSVASAEQRSDADPSKKSPAGALEDQTSDAYWAARSEAYWATATSKVDALLELYDVCDQDLTRIKSERAEIAAPCPDGDSWHWEVHRRAMHYERLAAKEAAECARARAAAKQAGNLEAYDAEHFPPP